MKNKRNKIFNICLILLYSIVIIFISKIHEFSIDELQSWLIARDLNLIDVIKQMKYEGHSFFWHLIIYPLAHFGISIYFQKAIPIIFCIITAIIIVKKAPFDNFIKVLLIFSPAMLFYSSQFARPYCLISLLLVCILLIYQKKDKHPYIYAILLGLLANMHLIVFPIVGMLALYFWGEKLFLHFKELSKKEKVNYIMSLIVLIIFILILATVTLFGLFNCKIVSEYEGIFDFIKRFFFSFIFNVVQFFQILLAKYNVSIIGSTICFIGLIYIFYSARYDFKNGLLFILQFVFMCFVHILFWFPIPSRVFLIIYEVMFWLWIYKLENKDNDKIPKFKKYNLLEWGLIFFLISTIPNNLSLIYKDITHNYTFGQEASKYIEKNIPENSVIISTATDRQQFLAAFLDKDKYKIYNVIEKDFITFTTWNDKFKTEIDVGDVINSYNDLKNNYENIYLFLVTLPDDNRIDDYEEIKKEYFEKLTEHFLEEGFKLEEVYSSQTKDGIEGYYIDDAVGIYLLKMSEV